MRPVNAIAVMVARRIGQAILAAFTASVLVFALLPLAPGDPAERILLSQGISSPTPDEIAAMRRQMGIDRPLPVQYVDWVAHVAQGDFGRSYRTGQPVITELARRAPATFLLLGTALLIAIAGALAASLTAVATAGRWPDKLIRGATQIIASMPPFILGLLFLQYVFVNAKFGRVLTQADPSLVWFPALALAAERIARWTQLLRANLLETLGAGYVLVARARGMSRTRILLRYALPNASLPFITAIGVSIGGIIGGAAIIESLFTWPGIGQFVLLALSSRDFPVIQGFVLISGLSYVLASLVVDLIALWLDPRLRTAAYP